ncbi:MAG TPA: chromosome segregation protein SMC [Armatimonadetes bacterium]|nr:chromosome segregation protein SMC [Armatimonadota bacterium]
MNRLTRVKLTGFKSIREMDLRLGNLTVLIGANGAGKSNLTSLFQMLNHAMSGHLRVHVAERGRAKSFLHHGPAHTQQVAVDLEYECEQGTNLYHARLGFAAGDSLIFTDETVAFRRGDQREADAPESLGVGHTESLLKQAGEEGNETALFAYNSLSRWRFYQFHDTSATAGIRLGRSMRDSDYLRHDGSNLAAYLQRLLRTEPDCYRKIIETIRLAAPFFDDFDLEPLVDSPDEVMLNWHAAGDDYPYGAHQLSDGTLRFMALATLLLQPTGNMPSLVVIDEPELGLHPYALGLLGSMVRAVTESVQVIMATQSVSLVDEFEPSDIVVVEQRDGQSTFERLDTIGLSGWLDAYSVSELWEKNVIGGRPRR